MIGEAARVINRIGSIKNRVIFSLRLIVIRHSSVPGILHSGGAPQHLIYNIQANIWKKKRDASRGHHFYSEEV